MNLRIISENMASSQKFENSEYLGFFESFEVGVDYSQYTAPRY
jgi:hypothetical protein